MKKYIKIFIYAIVSILLFISVNYLFTKEGAEERKIVIFNEFVNMTYKESIIKKAKATKIKNVDLVNGISVLISSDGIKYLEQQPKILRVDDDVVANISGEFSKTQPKLPPQPKQKVPWGIDKIDAEKVFTGITASAIKIGIIDTGIDLAHPDIKSNVKGGYNVINSKNKFTDDNGHGTHIAGIIAAINNSIGVVGVAPGADLYAIKVLNSKRIGYTSDIVEGIDWAIKNKIQIINMSFNIPNDIKSLHDSIIRANNAGIILVASAGNLSGRGVTYPAAYDEVISVSAIDSSNKRLKSSSIGKIDISAPGLDIYSTYMGSSYSCMSGTSMAAAHVTGVVALLLSQPNKCDLNKDGICSPSEVLTRLEKSSIDLGLEGKDSYFGSGLINAYNALYY